MCLFMDSQLEEIVQLFERQGINYWLDSGTLLGLMREGKLLEHDEDIDIGLWKEEEEALQRVLPIVEEMGYTVHRVSYRNEAFHYLFKPGTKKRRLIELTLYTNVGDHAYSPVFYFKLQSKRETSKEHQGHRIKKSLLSVVRRCIRSTWKMTFAKVLKDLDISFFLWRPFIKTGFWWIPEEFFQNLVYDERIKAYRPHAYDGYLTYRYGDWRRPHRDWVFYLHDRGIQHIELHQNPQNLGILEEQ